MLKGKYQFVEVEIEPTEPHHGAARWINIRALNDKNANAYNPSCCIGVVVDLDNGIDRILIINDDAYQIGKIGVSSFEHKWFASEGFGRYYGIIKPGIAEMIMKALNIVDK